jgi:hypothetical protein
MEGDFLFFLEDQVALVGSDTSVARDLSNWTVFTCPCTFCSVLERERGDGIIRAKAPTHIACVSQATPTAWPPPHLSQLST